MPTSLRIPPEKEKRIMEMARRRGLTKTAFILAAIDEKLGIVENREALIRKAAGWMDRETSDELREAVETFSTINDGDWP